MTEPGRVEVVFCPPAIQMLLVSPLIWKYAVCPLLRHIRRILASLIFSPWARLTDIVDRQLRQRGQLARAEHIQPCHGHHESSR